MDINRCLTRYFLLSSILWFGVRSFECNDSKSDVESRGFDEFKLDRIIEQLEHINLRQDELFKLVNRIESSCQLSRCSSSEEAGMKSNRKRDDTAASSKQLNINKLAYENDYENDLSNWDNSPQSDLSDSSSRDIRLKFLVLRVGQHYEAMFGEALNNLHGTLKEQLLGFRLGLKRLMSNAVDHTFQYSSILNQLNYLKEECSLAFTYNNASKTLEGSVPERTIEPSIKASDINMIARMVSDQVSQAVGRSSKGSSITNEELLELHRLEREQTAEVGAVSSRLSQMDSVIKQSALFLSKLNLQIGPLLQSSLELHRGNSHNTVVVTNNSNSSAAQSTEGSTSGKSESKVTRWFSGSKVPNQNRMESPGEGNNKSGGNVTSIEGLPVPAAQKKCHSKTSLVTPSSCQQLRQAGANCSGQYYVFIKSSIRYVYCDMNMLAEDEGGGWTVILRRIDKSSLKRESRILAQQTQNHRPSPGRQLMESLRAAQLDFKLDWFNYKSGFGYLDEWDEFFIGLDLLNQLSAPDRESGSGGGGSSELQVDLETSGGLVEHIRYDSFSVGGEESGFRFQVAGCNSSRSLCEPIERLNNSSFLTFDRLGMQRNCGSEAFGGWWIPEPASSTECPNATEAFSLTKPIEGANRLLWPTSGGHGEPIRRIVLKVRRKR